MEDVKPMSALQFIQFAESLTKAQAAPDLYTRIAADIQRQVLQAEKPLQTIVNTQTPVSSTTILFMACHISTMHRPADVPSAVMVAASKEAHEHQEKYNNYTLFSDFLTSKSAVGYRERNEVFTLTSPLMSIEELASDILMIEDSDVYLIEIEQDSTACAVAKIGGFYYHLYPNEDGLLMAGPCDLISVCQSLMYNYPAKVDRCVRLLIRKK